MGLVLNIIIASFIAIALYFYLWARNHYSYWRRRGVKHPKPIYFLGNSKPLKMPPSTLYTELYKRYPNEKFIGFYELTRIRVLLIDPDVIQNVLIKDFSHFTDRGSITASSDNAESGIFMMKGQRWRAVRNKLSPTFTSGKLKMMFDRMVECYHNLEIEIENSPKDNEIEARELMFSYTSDIIASCAFGLDVYKDKNSGKEFRRMGLQAFKMDLKKMLTAAIIANFPVLSKFMNIPFLSVDSMKYFGKVLKDALKYRRETGYSRNDFLQLLIQLKEKGSVEHHAIEPEDEYLNISKSHTTESFEFTESLVMAQAFTFITAGMEPSGNTLTFVCVELAKNQDIQDRIRKEITIILDKHDNQFTYQSLKEMDFLEHCIFETLRMYPVGQQLRRVCTKKYQLEGLTLDVGTNVLVPVRALHRDERYFPCPDVFNPDRFKHPIPNTFFPFGDGPRICIGMRFAMVEMMVVLSKLIQNFRLKPGKNFQYPVPLNKWSFFSVPSQPVNIRFEKINNDI